MSVKPGELFQQILQSEGEQLHWKIQTLAVAYFVFEGNTRELLARIAQLEDRKNAAKLCDAGKREAFRLIQRDTTRLVHNFLASVTSLIDHTRVVTNHLYIDSAFHNEYQAKVKETFAESPLASLVKGLRHWSQHRGVLPISMQFTFQNGFSGCAVLLDLNQLRSSDKWNTQVRSYLAGLSASPSLQEIVRSYASLVESFYLWLQQRMAEIHADAFQELEDLQERLREQIPSISK